MADVIGPGGGDIGGGTPPGPSPVEQLWSGPYQAMPENVLIEPGYAYAIQLTWPVTLDQINVPGIGSGQQLAQSIANFLADRLRQAGFTDSQFVVVVGNSEARMAVDNTHSVPPIVLAALIVGLPLLALAIILGIHVWRTTGPVNELAAWSMDIRDALAKSGALGAVAQGVAATAQMLPVIVILLAFATIVGRR